MDIQILHLIEGARQATGLTVIIDVFRAFTVEAYLACKGAAKIIPVGDVQTAFDYKAKHPDAILCGERKGVIIDGFDYGNSPSQLQDADLRGKTVIHTTSAGTQGIVNAIHADEIIGGSLVCARAIAEYIKQSNAKTVSLVCMGLHGKTRTEEDTLCAEYIKALAEGTSFPDLQQRIERLKETDGAKFFDPEQQSIFPEADFHMCVKKNIFPFVLRLKKDPESGLSCMEQIVTMNTRQYWAFSDVTQVCPGAKMSDFTRQQAICFPEGVKSRLVYESHAEPTGNFDCALVLGGPAEFMESRALAAAKLYHAGRVPLLVTTGGVYWDSPFGCLPESRILAGYLERAGVPAEHILCEDQATSTIENMKNSYAILQEKHPGKALRIAVVTSNFHASRASALAKNYFPTYSLEPVGAEYPHDNAREFMDDPVICQWVANECRCLWNHVNSGRIPDFPVA